MEAADKYDSNTLKQLRNRFQHSDPLKVVLGAGDVWYGHEWIATNEEDLDILDIASWEYFFRKKRANFLVAEHVWEHFTDQQAFIGLRHVYHFLAKDGNFRIAVPDGYFPDPDYINNVKPGGIGPGADDHKVLYNYELLLTLLASIPFRTTLLEYWDEKGRFHHAPWNASHGFIKRSLLYDERNTPEKIGYTSLIIDCKK